MKHVKLFEEFNEELTPEEIGGTNSFILIDGKILHFWEESEEGVAGEPIYVWKFNIDGKDIQYEDIETLLKPQDKIRMEQIMKKTEDENTASAKSFAEKVSLREDEKVDQDFEYKGYECKIPYLKNRNAYSVRVYKEGEYLAGVRGWMPLEEAINYAKSFVDKKEAKNQEL